MNMSWPIIVVAVLGVIGTFGAAVTTQVLTTRREERRAARDREDQQRRWDREQKDRSYIWQREDELRHRETREEVYTQFMRAIWAWGRKASAARTALQGGAKNITREQYDDLTASAVEAVDTFALLELTASAPVRKPARDCCNLISSFNNAFLAKIVDQEKTLKIHDSYKVSARQALELMRQDRGLPPGGVVANGDAPDLLESSQPTTAIGAAGSA
ncbi:hypothetical protein [Actinoplanes friuliensis]|uniref:hypothetical protein n=1 Tax=Actinoplanes friuliensis TaxID=196914 RepID=UPI0011DCF3ED|nr:hypothetical protein [Actinoplanes friuliensis]